MRGMGPGIEIVHLEVAYLGFLIFGSIPIRYEGRDPEKCLNINILLFSKRCCFSGSMFNDINFWSVVSE